MGFNRFSICFAAFALWTSTLSGQTSPVILGLGDSIGEGVQSADANYLTQPNSYLNLLAAQAGVAFPLPLISVSPTGVVDNPAGRSRLDVTVRAANLAFSGADSGSIITRRPQNPPVGEADLVLPPYTGSQVETAELLGSPVVICWIGNNDVLSAVTTFDHLDASQMTSVAQFTTNYRTLIDRLSASVKKANGRLLVANIPDVSRIGFLFDASDLRRFLGSDYGLPAGSYTTLIAMLLVRTGLEPASILQDPNWILDASEVAALETRVHDLNAVIASEAARTNAVLVDVNGFLNAIAASPVTVDGIAVSSRYLGGFFSLDGVHPSNFGQALLAELFIATIDSSLGAKIPLLSSVNLEQIFRDDPFVDFNGSGRVRGRPGAGMLESLGPLFGISGNAGNVPHSSQTATSATLSSGGAAASFMSRYRQARNLPNNGPWTQTEATAAMRDVFGVRAH